MYRLLKRIDHTEVQGRTLEALKEIQSKFEPCSVISRRELPFQVANVKAEELVFNREISMDLFEIDGKYVLHIIDTDTHFSTVRFLNNRMNVDDVWDVFLSSCTLIYGYIPAIMFCYYGSVFMSGKSKEVADENGAALILSGVHYHNGIIVCERYHAPLGTIYWCIRIECPEVDENLALQSAVKAMNDTVAPEGLVPLLLAFRVHSVYKPAG